MTSITNRFVTAITLTQSVSHSAVTAAWDALPEDYDVGDSFFQPDELQPERDEVLVDALPASISNLLLLRLELHADFADLRRQRPKGDWQDEEVKRARKEYDLKFLTSYENGIKLIEDYIKLKIREDFDQVVTPKNVLIQEEGGAWQLVKRRGSRLYDALTGGNPMFPDAP